MRTRLRSMKRRHGILELLEPRVLMDGENYLHIIWKGADYTDPITHQIILQNSDITGITFNMFAGQLISLGCDSNVPDPSPGPIYNVYWDLGYHAQHDYSIIKNFWVSDPSVPAQYSKGHVDPLPDEDTAKPTISFYSTADSPGHTFNLAYFPPPLEAALTATTTINILKPGKSIWPSNPPPVPGDGNDDGIVDIQDLTNLLFHWQQPVTGGASDGDINGDGFVDIQDMSILQNHWQQSRNPAYFQVALTQAGLSQVEEGVLQVAPPIAWTTMLPSPIPSPYNGNLGYVGEVSWVQLVNCWNWSGNALFRHPALTTDGTYMLDNTYPYNDTPGANNDSDAPSIASRWGDDELSITQNCEDWLMWRPPGGGSIPVPIQYFQWGVYAHGVWVGDHWIPTTAHIGPYYEGGVNTDGMPQWDAKLVNTDHSGEG